MDHMEKARLYDVGETSHIIDGMTAIKRWFTTRDAA